MADSDLLSGPGATGGVCEIAWAFRPLSPSLTLTLPTPMAVMAWFKKERKPRTSQRERLEIPADAWEKCDSCGHIDIREKFEKALNVCPECGKHRRIGAEEYIELLTDPGTWRELYAGLRSADPLEFENWTRLSCRTFAANAVRLQLHSLAYNLGNFMRTLAIPETAEPWSLTSLREKLIKIGAKVVSHGRYVTFQMAEVAVPRQMFADILSLIARLRAPPAPA